MAYPGSPGIADFSWLGYSLLKSVRQPALYLLCRKRMLGEARGHLQNLTSGPPRGLV